jgi:very-short-patch-repair endonuclease
MAIPNTLLAPSLDAKIAVIAAKQHGVFSKEQVLSLGASRGFMEHRLRTRRWEQLYRGVYRLRGTPRSWEQALMAACLASDGFVSYRAAAAAWGFPGFQRRVIEITTPRTRRFRADFPVHQSVYLPTTDFTRKGVIPISTPLRTVIDLAGVVPKDALEEILDDALVRDLVSIRRVDCWLRKLPTPLPGIGQFKEVVDARRDGGIPESVMETRLFRELRKKGVELPQRQHIIFVEGKFVKRVDFAYPQGRIVIEMDSRGFHQKQRQFDRDRVTSNQLGVAGWLVLHFTWKQLVEDPDFVCESIRSALNGRRVTNTAI